MTIPKTDLRAMGKDLLVLLGIPAVFVAAIGYSTWPWTTPPFETPSQEAFFDLAAGTWDWESDSSCATNPQVVTFSEDRQLMLITMREKWETAAGDSVRAAVYELSTRSPSRVRGAIRREQRLTDDGKPVEWELVLQDSNHFAWHRTDWADGNTTKSLVRCPAGADTLVPPLSGSEREALGLEPDAPQTAVESP